MARRPTSAHRPAPEAPDLLARLAPVLPELMRAMQRNRGQLPQLGRTPLGSRHASMLVSISAAGPATVSELAARLGISSPHASLVVRELAQAGMIEREHDPADRRRVIVSMSELAKPAMQLIRDRMDGPLRRFLSELGPGEAEVFIVQLKRFAELLAGEG